MSRAWNLRYLAQKAELGLREAMQDTTSNYLQSFMNAFNRPLISEISMGGKAMLPTLGQAAEGTGAGGLDRLVVREIRDASSSSIFVGDIVAFGITEVGSGRKLVRRVAALEGEEMVSSSPSDEPFVLEPGHCWVLADNQDLEPKEAVDSRTFGPVPLSSVLGRVVYYHRSPTDHGLVHNSEEAMAIDEPVLECEVDPELLNSRD